MSCQTHGPGNSSVGNSYAWVPSCIFVMLLTLYSLDFDHFPRVSRNSPELLRYLGETCWGNLPRNSPEILRNREKFSVQENFSLSRRISGEFLGRLPRQVSPGSRRISGEFLETSRKWPKSELSRVSNITNVFPEFATPRRRDNHQPNDLQARRFGDNGVLHLGLNAEEFSERVVPVSQLDACIHVADKANGVTRLKNDPPSPRPVQK